MPKIPPLETGVYRWRNVVNGMPYYGSTSKGFSGRRKVHLRLLRKGKHHSIHFQRAWNKYGEDSFVFEVVERCPPKMCLEREQHYLDTVRPWDSKIGYNRSRVAGSVMDGRKHTEETKVLLAELGKGRTHSEETKAKMSRSMTGKPRSEEARRAITEAQQARRAREQAEGFVLPEETRAKMASRKGKKWSEEVKAKIAASNRVTMQRKLEDPVQAEQMRLQQERMTEAAAIANRGRERSAEERAAISAGRKGITRTEEWNAKLSGDNHWSKQPENTDIVAATAEKLRGQKHSEEHKAKIAASHWKYREDAAKIGKKAGEARRGQKRTAEQRANIADARRASHARRKQHLAEQAALLAELQAAHPVIPKRVTFGH